MFKFIIIIGSLFGSSFSHASLVHKDLPAFFIEKCDKQLLENKKIVADFASRDDQSLDNLTDDQLEKELERRADIMTDQEYINLRKSHPKVQTHFKLIDVVELNSIPLFDIYFQFGDDRILSQYLSCNKGSLFFLEIVEVNEEIQLSRYYINQTKLVKVNDEKFSWDLPLFGSQKIKAHVDAQEIVEELGIEFDNTYIQKVNNTLLLKIPGKLETLVVVKNIDAEQTIGTEGTYTIGSSASQIKRDISLRVESFDDSSLLEILNNASKVKSGVEKQIVEVIN